MNSRHQISDTLKFVVNAHHGQLRKGGLPYAVHVVSVLKKLDDWSITDPNTLKAGLAHDILEDCPEISYDMLVAEIGKESADIVKELTFIPDTESSISTQVQKNEFMSKFGEKSIEAYVIKLADRVMNTYDFYNEDTKIRSNRPYANKYWQKALKIRLLIDYRKTEIIEKYGADTYKLILHSLSSMDVFVAFAGGQNDKNSRHSNEKSAIDLTQLRYKSN